MGLVGNLDDYLLFVHFEMSLGALMVRVVQKLSLRSVSRGELYLDQNLKFPFCTRYKHHVQTLLLGGPRLQHGNNSRGRGGSIQTSHSKQKVR